MIDHAVVYTDGAARGNPGPASIGAAIYEWGIDDPLLEVSEAIGRATNNVAEYRAVIAGLELLQQVGAKQVTVRADSQLLVNQLNGSFRVKAANLKPLFRRVKELAGGFDRIEFEHVRREHNTVADALANAALDR